jgi:hypothetical protein
MGFGMLTGFIEHLQIITTTNYSAITNSHNQQFIMACTTLSKKYPTLDQEKKVSYLGGLNP